jgi:hypothetical protein
MPRRNERLYLPLDVDYFRDEAIAEARSRSPWAELLFIHLCCEAKERETDGRISAAIASLTGVPAWRKWIGVLVEVGLILVDGDGWIIRSFTRKNLTASQIAERRAGTAERVEKHREQRRGNALQPPQTQPGNGRGNALPLSPKPEAQSSSTTTPTTPIGLSEPEGGGGFLPETRAAIAALANLEADASPVPIGNRSAWLKAVQQRISDERGGELEAAALRLGRRVDCDQWSPAAVIDEADRHARTMSLEPGARSWGRSRADLTFADVAAKARESWPDDDDLQIAALDAWSTAQTVQKDDVA